ncbi:hypothetical protein GCM10027290_35690 [Micromonospora sonneratiae]
MKPPRSASGWTIAVFGGLALLLGAVGLVWPDVLLNLLGFEVVAAADRVSGDHTRTFMAASSMASLNMGVYYLLAASSDWRPFFRFTVGFRLLTFAVFTLLVVMEIAPVRFLGVAVWEGLGAVATGVALWSERRERVRPGQRGDVMSGQGGDDGADQVRGGVEVGRALSPVGARPNQDGRGVDLVDPAGEHPVPDAGQ